MQKYREKLLGFVGDKINDINVSRRQKEAVQKMLFLNQQQFEDLVIDVSNEIEIRTKNEPEHALNSSLPLSRNSSRKKLGNLNEESFFNLVVDVLLTMNNSEGSNKREMCDLLDDLDSILADLKKSKTDEEKVIKEIESVDDYESKQKIFIRYLIEKLKKYNLDISVVDAMQTHNGIYFDEKQKYIKSKLFAAKSLLEYSAQFYGDNLPYEYLYHQSNINRLIEKRPRGYKSLVKLEMIHIFALLLDKHNVIEDESYIESSLREDTSILIRSLENFVKNLRSNMEGENIGSFAGDLIASSRKFLRKLESIEDTTEEGLYRTYEIRQKNLESVIRKNTVDYELFNCMIEFTYVLRELIAILNIDI